MQTLKPRLPTARSRLTPASKPSQEPGYRIRGRELQRIRAEHFRRNPMCAKCMAKGIMRIATELDHIVPIHLGGTETPHNRQSLCTACHTAKSEAERLASL